MFFSFRLRRDDRFHEGGEPVVVFERAAGGEPGASPEIFEVRDDGYLYVLDENPPDTMRAKVEEAVRVCPTQAISIAD